MHILVVLIRGFQADLYFSGMENAEFHIAACKFRIPRCGFWIPHFAFRIPRCGFRISQCGLSSAIFRPHSGRKKCKIILTFKNHTNANRGGIRNVWCVVRMRNPEYTMGNDESALGNAECGMGILMRNPQSVICKKAEVKNLQWFSIPQKHKHLLRIRGIWRFISSLATFGYYSAACLFGYFLRVRPSNCNISTFKWGLLANQIPVLVEFPGGIFS